MFKYVDKSKPEIPQLQVGDVVFIRIPTKLFLKVADASGSWSNHVGIIVEHDGLDWVVAESCVPVVRRRHFGAFVRRSEGGRFVVRRLPLALTKPEQMRLQEAANKRMGQLYHTGFALRSPRQFCSKFVHEVLQEACGESVGEVETFSTLLARNPQVSLSFWRFWFFGRIPWQRETITPDSQLRSEKLQTVFAG